MIEADSKDLNPRIEYVISTSSNEITTSLTHKIIISLENYLPFVQGDLNQECHAHI